MVSTSGLHIWRPHIFGVVWPPPGPQNLYCLSANLLHFLTPSPFSADVIHGSPFVRARYTSRSNLRILSRSSCREKWHWQAVMYAGAYPLVRKSYCSILATFGPNYDPPFAGQTLRFRRPTLRLAHSFWNVVLRRRQSRTRSGPIRRESGLDDIIHMYDAYLRYFHYNTGILKWFTALNFTIKGKKGLLITESD